MKRDSLMIVRGGGDLATGTIHRLWSAGLRVLILETEHPAAIRRQVSLCEAVYEGETTVEGLRAVRISKQEEAEAVWAQNAVPVLIDPKGESIRILKPDVVVDAILAKKNLGTTREMAPLTIALGPGFTAGQDVDVVVETKRGHKLGRIIREGAATPNTGVPGVIGGYAAERVLHSSAQGIFRDLHTIGDFERISDHAVNLIKTAEEIRDKSIKFSDEALGDLSVLEAAVQDIVNRTVDAFQKGDTYAAKKIEPLEQVVDGLVREVKSRHIARLQAGACTIEYGFVLDDLLTNYERIADHCSNIAVAMIEVAADKFDTHEYLNTVKHGDDVKFERRYEKYRGRYTFPPEAYSEPAENQAEN